VVLHGWNTAVGLAADLQLTAALEQAKFVEYQTGTPYIDGILASPFKLDKDGMLPVPTGPGLGVDVDLALVKRHGPQ
jgi:L-alanine-DL-glutamate epimerase-like enolase superfamily enzyme